MKKTIYLLVGCLIIFNILATNVSISKIAINEEPEPKSIIVRV